MRRLLTLFGITLLTFGSFAGVSAHGDDNNNDRVAQYDRDGDDRDGDDRDRNRDGDRQERDAVSYINPDIGAATVNPDVNANSSCFNPDQ